MAKVQSWGITLKRIVDQMVETGVTDLDVRRGDLRLRLKRQTWDAGESNGLASKFVTRSAGVRDEVMQESHALLAPLTGVFYASPNPAAKSYVEVGDWVEEGAVVGLIETMKVFNEVTADCRGRIVAIQALQGQLVQAGEVVALVDTAATPDQDVEVGP